MKKDIGRTVKYLDWNGKIACQDVDKHLRLDTSQISTSANCFMFILVESGGCEFNFIRQRMRLSAGEVMVFPPTYPPREIVASSDYKALGLIVQRDYAYHQGTAWPWLAGFYLEACLKVFGYSRVSFVERQLVGYEEELFYHCIGTLPEVFDGNPPFHGRGAMSFAMNVAEIMRVVKLLDKYIME